MILTSDLAFSVSRDSALFAKDFDVLFGVVLDDPGLTISNCLPPNTAFLLRRLRKYLYSLCL